MLDNIKKFKTMAEIQEEENPPVQVDFHLEGESTPALEGFSLISSLGRD